MYAFDASSNTKMDTNSTPESWSTTEHQTVRFAHKWTVDKFDYYLDMSQEEHPKIESPKFSPPTDETLQFHLTVYPKGAPDEIGDNVSVFLSLDACKNAEVRAKFTVSIVDQTKGKTNSFASINNFRNPKEIPERRPRNKFVVPKTNSPLAINLDHERKSWGWKKFISHEILCNQTSGLLPDNKLTMFCEIEAIVDSIETLGMNELGKQAETQVVDDLARLLQNAHLTSDFVILSTDSGTVIEKNGILYHSNRHHAHKAILIARSTVFASMFEKQPNKIQLNVNADFYTTKAMLQFIYTGKVQNLDVHADKLLVLANVCALGQLKSMCEASLVSQLSPDNVVNMLVLADQNSAKQLRSKAIEYINVNLSAIMQTDNWKVIEEQPKLYFELFSKLLAEKVVK